RLPALALDRGERRGECLLRRGLVAPFALLVKIHGRAMELDEEGSRLGGRRIAPEIFPRQRIEREFVLAAALPQEIHVDACRQLLRLAHEVGQPPAFEPDKYIRRLDLGALAVRSLDLQRSDIVGEHGADFEIAIFFVKDVLTHRLRELVSETRLERGTRGLRRARSPAPRMPREL